MVTLAPSPSSPSVKHSRSSAYASIATPQEGDPASSLPDELMLELENLIKGHRPEPRPIQSVSSVTSPLTDTTSVFSARQGVSTQATSPYVCSSYADWPKPKLPSISRTSSVAGVHGSGSENEREKRRTTDLEGFGAWADDIGAARAPTRKLRRKEKVVVHQHKRPLELVGDKRCPCHSIETSQAPTPEPLPIHAGQPVLGTQIQVLGAVIALANLVLFLCLSTVLAFLFRSSEIKSSPAMIARTSKAALLAVVVVVMSSFTSIIMIHFRRSFVEISHVLALLSLGVLLFLPVHSV